MRIALIGYGRMGKMVEACMADMDGMQVAGIVDTCHLSRLSDIAEVDAAIDFSFPGDLDGLLADATAWNIPLVIGRTGLTAGQEQAIAQAALAVPIVHASNFSLGVAVMRRAVRDMARALDGLFDVEIVEAHHRGKLDAPSGTAELLIRDIDPEGKRPIVHGRKGSQAARGNEIGVHALRGGTVSGEHTVHFYGDMEELSITHRADSRSIFARGALIAARFVIAQPPGLYSMEDVLFGSGQDG